MLSELPRYVRNIEGYHKAKGRMYFRGTDGNSTFSTETGERIELSQALTSAEVSSPDWDTTVVQLVEGVGWAGLSHSKGDFTGKLLQYQICIHVFPSSILSDSFFNIHAGSYFPADFDGIKHTTHGDLVQWKSCCGDPPV